MSAAGGAELAGAGPAGSIANSPRAESDDRDSARDLSASTRAGSGTAFHLGGHTNSAQNRGSAFIHEDEDREEKNFEEEKKIKAEVRGEAQAAGAQKTA